MLKLWDKYMENSSTQIGKDEFQHHYTKIIELEHELMNFIQVKTPPNLNIWGNMCENYEAIILEDCDFYKAHEPEHALWNLHYKRIKEFRA